MSEPLIDIRPDHWAIVADILRRHVPDREVWAFGSRATWNAKEYSDLDLAVIGETPLSLSVSALLADDFAGSDLPFKVDLVDWATTSEAFRKIIERDKVVAQRAGPSSGMAASEWAPIRLGDVCMKIGSGATPRGGSDVYLQDGPYALIRSQNVYNDGFHHDGLAFIDEKHAAELENVKVLDGDVLLNITGDSVARACQVDPGVLPARVNQHVAIIRPDPGKLAPRFLRYVLVSHEMQTKLLSWAGCGGTRNALTKGMIESFDVLAPTDVAEQHAIAHILGTLDDKIELNRRMNETLEAMARALFKSWFVDFDPVRAKMNLPSPPGRGAGGEGTQPSLRTNAPIPTELLDFARQLRRQATDAEAFLWRLLRGRQLANAKFRRQDAFPPYILDFYCHELKLAVELDGGQHNEDAGRRRDARRDEYLAEQGIQVLRFWNNDVLRETEAVLEAIHAAVVEHSNGVPSPPPPLPEGEGSFGIPKPLADHFPARLVDSELGEIPEGWEVGRVGDVGNLICGKTPPTQVSGYYGDNVPFITIPDMHGKIFATATQKRLSHAGAASQQKKMLPAGAICVSCIATPGLVVITSEPVQTNQQINTVVPSRSDETYFWFWALRSLGDKIRAGGSGGSVLTNLSTGRFAELNVLSPPPGLRSSYHLVVAPVFGRILESERESRTLAALRDTLLSKLISGELRVKQMETEAA